MFKRIDSAYTVESIGSIWYVWANGLPIEISQDIVDILLENVDADTGNQFTSRVIDYTRIDEEKRCRYIDQLACKGEIYDGGAYYMPEKRHKPIVDERILRKKIKAGIIPGW